MLSNQTMIFTSKWGSDDAGDRSGGLFGGLFGGLVFFVVAFEVALAVAMIPLVISVRRTPQAGQELRIGCELLSPNTYELQLTFVNKRAEFEKQTGGLVFSIFKIFKTQKSIHSMNFIL